MDSSDHIILWFIDIPGSAFKSKNEINKLVHTRTQLFLKLCVQNCDTGFPFIMNTPIHL